LEQHQYQRQRDNPYHPDAISRLCRSPVLGTPTGWPSTRTACGVNEPFGDNLTWDLVARFAIDRLNIIPTNPVYGLNALGRRAGARMKNGFTYHGGELELSAGIRSATARSRCNTASRSAISAPISASTPPGTMVYAGCRRHASSNLRRYRRRKRPRQPASQLHRRRQHPRRDRPDPILLAIFVSALASASAVSADNIAADTTPR